MTTVGKKTLLLGLVVAALVACTTVSAAPAADSTVTISNPARLVVDVLVGDEDVKVATDVMTVNLDDEQQDILIQTADGQATELHVQDGDVVVVYPDPADPGSIAVQVLSLTAAKPSFSSMKPGIPSPPSSGR